MEPRHPVLSVHRTSVGTVRYRRLPDGGIAVEVDGGRGLGQDTVMHPLTYAVIADVLRDDRLREAAAQRRVAQARRARRRARPDLRSVLGYRLVELGLRLAVRRPLPRLGAR